MGYLSPPPAPAPVVVYKDVGGLVSEYEAQTDAYRREGREVRLHECRSACTLALSLPNVCVYPDAKVKFHQAYNAITREVDQGVSAQLFAAYPAAVQGRLGHLTRDYRVLSGTELIALGMRNCNGPQRDEPRTMIASRKKPNTIVARAGADTGALGDIARNVRTAVASWTGAGQSDALRVTVPDRRAVPAQTLARLSGDGASALPPLREHATPPGLPVEIPLPPRRPPSLAMTLAPATAAAPPGPTAIALAEPAGPRLIVGAQPILPTGQFMPRRP